MFNVFAARSSSDVQIAKSAKHLLTLMKRAISSRQAAIDARGDEHHEIDLRHLLQREYSPFGILFRCPFRSL